MTIQASITVAGVAQTAHNAQQVARGGERIKGNPANEARQVREKFESHLQSFEDDNGNESPTHLHVDAQLPQQGGSGQGGKQAKHAAKSVTSQESESVEVVDEATDAQRQPGKDALYRHLDVRA